MKNFELDAGRIQAAHDSAPHGRDDRRREPRFRPVTENLYVGWWEREMFRTELGRLRNISTRGAAIELDVSVPNVESVWLCVVGPGCVTWAPACVAGREDRILRLQFAAPFPDVLLEPLVWGFPVP